VCAFIAVWWSVRLGIALLGCERREVAKRPAWVRWADRVLLVAFAGLALGYGTLAAGGWTTAP
jgi:threonine/homoserine/homoserine lactone efflux protein